MEDFYKGKIGIFHFRQVFFFFTFSSHFFPLSPFKSCVKAISTKEERKIRLVVRTTSFEGLLEGISAGSDVGIFLHQR